MSGSISNTIRRSVTFSGAAKVMPRWRHSSTSYFGLELVFHEFEQRRARKSGNREHGLENRLQTFVETAALRLVDQQN